MVTAYDFDITALDGEREPLSRYRGQPLLLVNVASHCGFTPQYTGLEALWTTCRQRGLVVIGFPCNQFGGQEPGDAAAIRAFCRLERPVSFPMSTKIEVNGAHADPLWRWLATQRRGLLGTARIKWNFTKFLVGRDGHVVGRYAPQTRPERLRAAVERALGP